MNVHLMNIDLSKVVEDDDNTNLTGELACAGGACEIKQLCVGLKNYTTVFLFKSKGDINLSPFFFYYFTYQSLVFSYAIYLLYVYHNGTTSPHCLPNLDCPFLEPL